MFLDGDEINKGDRLYHISAGYGVVETIAHDQARIRMDSGGILNMGENGFSGGRKSFYWYPPIFLIPRKGKEAIHQKAINFATTALEILENE